jgi:hypothetical protein
MFDWRDQAAALATYFRGKELQGPMLGAQRRVEATGHDFEWPEQE